MTTDTRAKSISLHEVFQFLHPVFTLPVLLAQHFLTQLLFVGVELHHSHLDAAVHDEANYLHLSQLAYSVHSLDGLVLNSGVPPGIHQEDLVGCH
jgi:hypothetical protein